MLLLLALMLQAPAPTPAPAKLTLVVWPVGVRVWQGVPLYSGARVRVDDPSGELPCPEIVVDWGDGSRSGVRSAWAGCDPYTQPPGSYTFVPKLHAYREPGRFTVEACVVDVRGECRAGLTARRPMSIRRPDEDPDQKWAGR